ncbi:Glycosyltransferase involved in cell wall bisynthesis [Mariniphaga anaerophila]|uniref:Glycosyltransferase involved in cell wall bisynthesis n=1 Tax=Mariniphaga anaerophila TaxID=1484053 RepID=A0A1M5CIG0_9BACT|nr:glycosyltransferase family 4 protein [Mariniphaga anaerophila]SHF54202.1 Glycosyltransferase involved in cell wall bisynthesis [Mariniphaga anaerophila]
MKVAVLSPVAWRTPPRHYGPWEQVASNITEGLVEKGLDVTLFATKDSLTSGKLEAVIDQGYEEDKSVEPKAVECLHIAHLMEHASEFDIIHNNFDFLPLSYSRLIKTPMITTIHGFSSPKIIPVFQEYNANNHYVSISNADRSEKLKYTATVYNGINKNLFTLNKKKGDYLLFFGRIHHDKGTWEAIQIAKKAKMKLIISGIIQDESYFDEKVSPYLNNDDIIYVGSSGPEKRDELLQNAFALLHPINFKEPFGLSVAEAMFCGTPVIAFEKGSMRELIVNGKTGYLVHSIDEAVERIKDIPQINREYCRTWAEQNFSKEKMTEDYIKVYQKILGNS